MRGRMAEPNVCVVANSDQSSDSEDDKPAIDKRRQSVLEEFMQANQELFGGLNGYGGYTYAADGNVVDGVDVRARHVRSDSRPRTRKRPDDESEFKVLKQWIRNTHCHGVNDLAKSKSTPGKAVWLLVILFSLTFMSYQLFSLFENYINNKKWSNTIYEENYPGGIDFPTITICDFNRLRRSKVARHNLSEDLIQFLFYTNGIRYTISQEPNITDRKRFMNWRLAHNMSYQDIFNTMGSECDEMFRYANIRNLRSPRPCSVPWLNITPVFTIEYGKCYQVRLAPKFQKVALAGGSWGLTLVLNLQLSEYLPVLINNYNDEGFALQLNYGAGVEFGTWLALTPGLHSWVSMTPTWVKTRKTRFTLFPPPCLYNASLKVLKGHFTRKQCIFDCIMQAVVQSCGCVFRIDSGRWPTCDMDYYDFCHRNIRIREVGKCRKDCIDPCEEKRLRASVSYSRTISKAQLSNMREYMLQEENRNETEQSLRHEYMAVDIYYETVAVTVIERYEMITLNQLISNIGGQLGLWAGMSVLTIYQAIIYLGRCIGICCRKRRRNTRRHIELDMNSSL